MHVRAGQSKLHVRAGQSKLHVRAVEALVHSGKPESVLQDQLWLWVLAVMGASLESGAPWGPGRAVDVLGARDRSCAGGFWR